LPLYLVVLLLLALALNLMRGFDLARRRSAEIQPRRTQAVLELRDDPAEIPEFSSDQRFVLVHLPPRPGTRLALHQIFPERDVVRWVEAEGSDGEWLVLPLAGLPEGEFGLRWADEGERAEAVNPDWQEFTREWLGRFRLLRP
jgi:hypothetical protein